MHAGRHLSPIGVPAVFENSFGERGAGARCISGIALGLWGRSVVFLGSPCLTIFCRHWLRPNQWLHKWGRCGEPVGSQFRSIALRCFYWTTPMPYHLKPASVLKKTVLAKEGPVQDAYQELLWGSGIAVWFFWAPLASPYLAVVGFDGTNLSTNRAGAVCMLGTSFVAPGRER